MRRWFNFSGRSTNVLGLRDLLVLGLVHALVCWGSMARSRVQIVHRLLLHFWHFYLDLLVFGAGLLARFGHPTSRRQGRRGSFSGTEARYKCTSPPLGPKDVEQPHDNDITCTPSVREAIYPENHNRKSQHNVVAEERAHKVEVFGACVLPDKLKVEYGRPKLSNNPIDRHQPAQQC